MKKFLLLAILSIINFTLKAQNFDHENEFVAEVRAEMTSLNDKCFSKLTGTAAYIIKNIVGVGLDGGGYRSNCFDEFEGDCNFHGGFIGAYVAPIVFDKKFVRIMIPIRSQIGSFKYSVQDSHYDPEFDDSSLQWQYHIAHHYLAQILAGVDIDFYVCDEISLGLSACYPIVHNNFELKNRFNNNIKFFDSNQFNKLTFGLTFKVNIARE